MKIEDKRFWSKVKVGHPDECWEWTGYLNSKGYGWMKRRKISENGILSHRYAFYLYNEILSENFICHKCDNPKCCNPNHLFEGTPLDNVRDMINKGRYYAGEKNGENNGAHKLILKEVREIRKLLPTMNNKQIARIYGVHHATISLIRLNKTWSTEI